MIISFLPPMAGEKRRSFNHFETWPKIESLILVDNFPTRPWRGGRKNSTILRYNRK
ncbi:MAG: hypothetical protein LBR79_02290 [Oscillospiraceae bacterium]|nr:hypothetical protein [Oscillospiraceae bacterium]